MGALGPSEEAPGSVLAPPPAMAVFLLLFAAPACLSCNARTTHKTRAKVVEEYVVSANFDENKNLPQLNDRTHSRNVRLEQGQGPGTSPPNQAHPTEGGEGRQAMHDRDLMVHHHHLPPPSPPVTLAYAPSLYAVGLIAFLMLLNSLQTSLLLLKPKNSVLGTVTGALGRRKRFASMVVREFELGSVLTSTLRT